MLVCTTSEVLTHPFTLFTHELLIVCVILTEPNLAPWTHTFKHHTPVDMCVHANGTITLTIGSTLTTSAWKVTGPNPRNPVFFSLFPQNPSPKTTQAPIN